MRYAIIYVPVKKKSREREPRPLSSTGNKQTHGGRMNREAAREQIKDKLTEYVEQITVKGKGRNTYVCPICHSGTGKNGTAAFNIDPHEPTRWHCFSCGNGGDIFDLVGLVESIPEYSARFTRLAEMFNIPVDKWDGTQTQAATPKPNIEQPKKTARPHDFTALFAGASMNIEKTDYWAKRGLSLDTVKRFGIGYIEDWRHPNHPETSPSPRLIIPVGNGGYIARATTQHKYPKMNAGTIGLFDATGYSSENTEAVFRRVYIVEGAIDAMSIAEAGGKAIALNSASNWRTFVEQISESGKYRFVLDHGTTIILALDRDSTGRDTTKKIIESISEIKARNPIECVVYSPSGDYKDPNDALVNDREGFYEAVSYGMNAPIDALKADTERKEYLSGSAYHHIQTLLSEIEESKHTPPISTGFKKLDEAFEGGLREGLYFLGAVSSLGKTTFVMQIADQIAMGGTDVLIFSLEMKRTELMSKSISRLTALHTMEHGGNIRDAKGTVGIMGGWRYSGYSQDEHLLIARSMEDYSKFAKHIYIHEGVGNIGVDEVRNTVEKHIAFTGRIPVVVIDYMQILAPIDPKASDKQNTDWTVVALKRMSRDNKVPVIGISSFNRENYNKPVGMASFKESGAIEYSSDILLGLQYEGIGGENFDIESAVKENPRRIQLKVLKNRNGTSGQIIPYSFYKDFNLFMERE